MTPSQRFASTVESFVGTKWVRGGRTPGDGLDCIGIVAAACAELGFAFEDWTSYQLAGPCPERYGDIVDNLGQVFERVETQDWRRGDVIAYRHPGCDGHVVVMLGSGRMIQANADKQGLGVHVATVPFRWAERLREVGGEWSCWRLKDV